MSGKILFLLDSLRSGGRERRAIELFKFLKNETDFEFKIVLFEKIIHYKYVYELGVPIAVLKKRKFKKDPSLFIRVFRVVKEYEPDLIHSWSAITTFYAIPSVFFLRIPLVNGQIANAISSNHRFFFDNFLWKINRFFSSVVIANSIAGLKAYKIKPKEGLVIHNGLSLDRFDNLADKKLIKNYYDINTKYSIIMVASFNVYKDYNLFFNVAKMVCDIHEDVTFIGLGEGATKSDLFAKYEDDKRILFIDQISEVENLVNLCDIGVLFSYLETGEGFPNTVMEYMALSKPVIATNSGGTIELVNNCESGYLVDNNKELIVRSIISLLDNSELRLKMGKKGRDIIEEHFTIDKMGRRFEKEYEIILSK